VGHARLSAAEREHGAADPTLTDDPVNPGDDALGREVLYINTRLMDVLRRP